MFTPTTRLPSTCCVLTFGQQIVFLTWAFSLHFPFVGQWACFTAPIDPIHDQHGWYLHRESITLLRTASSDILPENSWELKDVMLTRLSRRAPTDLSLSLISDLVRSATPVNLSIVSRAQRNFPHSGGNFGKL